MLASVQMRAFVAIQLAGFAGIALSQTSTVVPVKTSLCEIVQEPRRFNGKLVEVSVGVVYKFQWTGLVDGACGAKIRMDAHHVLDDLKSGDGEYAFTTLTDDLSQPKRLNWRPIQPLPLVTLTTDENYRTLQEYAGAKFRWKDGGTCLDCPLYEVTARVIGRFEFFETQTVALRANPATEPFLLAAGEANIPLFRFVLRQVFDVGARPINSALYSKSSRRTVMPEEADELVRTYIKAKVCRKNGCGLEPFYPQFPDWFGFQAVRDNPGGSANLGFFLVDERTADVWSGVACEKFSSSALDTLQQKIRRRMGLKEDEYQKVQRRGPYCDLAEMPRRVHVK